jgi:hypothetical protein
VPPADCSDRQDGVEKDQAVQLVDPRTFGPAAIRRLDERMMRPANVLYLAHNASYGVSLAGKTPRGAIAWLRKAPSGTPFPDLRRRGTVSHIRYR